MSGSRGPLGFGEDEERPRQSEAPEPDLWLPGRPAGGDGHEERPRKRSRLPGIVLTCAVFALLVLAGLNTLRTEGVSSSGPAEGSQIPPFAAPLVNGGPEGDVNLAVREDQGAAGKHPACEVRDARVVTSCTLTKRPSVIVFFADGQRRCVDQLDVLSEALAAHPSVEGLAVAVRGDRSELKSLVARHGWRFRTVQDRDGGMSNVYGVAVCPQMTFVRPGGRVLQGVTGSLDRAELDDALSRLEARSDAIG